ncbi:RidA family protein [Leucobacter zeae]|nr:RidA family protein [Leucobacter zeae]
MVTGGNPEALAPPIGPFRHYTVVPAGHRLVYLSGQVGQDRNGVLAPGGCAAQTAQTFRNLELLLGEIGATPAHVVKLFTIVAGSGNFREFSRARAEVFARWYPDQDYPAHSAFVAAELAAPDLLVEIEAVVAVPM